jgi:beta-N-acetylhexosaminidase
MPGLVPGIHALFCRQGVDGRDKPGHDERNNVADPNAWTVP